MNNTSLKIPETEEERLTIVSNGGPQIKSQYLLIGSVIIVIILNLCIYGIYKLGSEIDQMKNDQILIGLVLSHPKFSEKVKDIFTKETQIKMQEIQNNVNQLKPKFDGLESDVTKLKEIKIRIEQLQKRTSIFQEDSEKLKQEALKHQKAAESQTKNTVDDSKIEELKEDISELKENIEQTTSQTQKFATSMRQFRQKNTEIQDQIKAVKKQIAQLSKSQPKKLGTQKFKKSKTSSTKSQNTGELAQKIDNLESEISNLKESLSKQKLQATKNQNKPVSSSSDIEDVMSKFSEIQSKVNEISDLSDQQAQLTERVKDLETLTTVLEQKMKEDYHNKKMDRFHEYLKNPALQDQPVRTPLLLSNTNIDLPYTDVLIERNMTAELKLEYDHLNDKYKIQKYKKEIPLCILIPTYNNINHWRYEYNIHSIVTQNYTNYRVLIIDDASTDQTNFMIRRYLKKHGISSDKIKIIRNSVKKSGLPNIHYTAHKFCKPEQKMMIVDGDDELIGKQIFKTLNAVYQAQKSVMVYSNHVTYRLYTGEIVKGYSNAYLPQHIAKNMYRDMNVEQRISQLRTFSVQHFRKIKDKDLKDTNGNFFTITYDESIFLPMAEMSCGRMTFIPEFFYIYNFGTGLNDYYINGQAQTEQSHYVRRQLPKYHCRPELKKKEEDNSEK